MCKYILSIYLNKIIFKIIYVGSNFSDIVEKYIVLKVLKKVF